MKVKERERELERLTSALKEAFFDQVSGVGTNGSVSVQLRAADGDARTRTTVTLSDTQDRLHIRFKALETGDESEAVIDGMTLDTLRKSLKPEDYILEKLKPVADSLV